MLARRDLLIIAGLILAIIICYAQVRHHDFVNCDDHIYITRNSQIWQGLTPANFALAFTTFEAANWHPLTWLSHMIDVDLFGHQNPAGHHITNVLLHIANTILLLLILRRLTGSPWRSAFVAALFALHPLHVESVAWVSERKDVLSTFFGFLAIAAYIKYTARPTWKSYSLIALLFACSLMSKPMLVTLPFLLLLLDYWPLKRIRSKNSPSLEGGGQGVGEKLATAKPRSSPKPPRLTTQSLHHPTSPKILILEKLPLLALSLASSIITIIAQSHGGAISSLDTVPFLGRLQTATIAYATYLWQMMWPINLSPLYSLPPHWPANTVALAAFILIAITAIAIILHRKQPQIIVGWLWYLGSLVPVIGLIQVGSQSHADRYTYVPLIGIFIAIAWSIPNPRSNRNIIFAYSAAAALLLSTLTALTHAQTHHWRNSIALATHGLAVTGPNAILHFNLANALNDTGDPSQALTHFAKAVELKPDWADPPFNLGNTLRKLGRLDEALLAYDEALRRNPRFVGAIVNRAIVLSEQGKLDLALATFQHAIDTDPQNPDAHRGLAQTLASLSRLDEAVDHFRIALDIQPDDFVSYLLLGNVLARQDHLDQAIACFSRSMQLNPNEPRTYMSMASALTEKQQPDLARNQLQIAADLATRLNRTDLLEEIRRRLNRLPPPTPQQ